MSRVSALLALLRHGPLTRDEIVEIMGGDRTAAEVALRDSCVAGLVRMTYGLGGPGRIHYRIEFNPPTPKENPL